MKKWFENFFCFLEGLILCVFVFYLSMQVSKILFGILNTMFSLFYL